MKQIDEGACKGNIPYYSFICRKTVEALLEYIQYRTQMYKHIDDKEPLFISESRNMPLDLRRNTIVMKKSLSSMVKRAARKAGIKQLLNK